MTNIEQRLYRLEAELTRDEQVIAQMLARIAALEQLQYGSGIGSGGAGGGGGGFYVCYPTTAIGAGTWSSGVPVNASQITTHVYLCQQNNRVTDLGPQTVTSWLPSSVVANKACIVVPDGLGNFAVIAQSCT